MGETMIKDGTYTYCKIDDEGNQIPKGSIKIVDNQLSIVSDNSGVLKHMFHEGPVTNRVMDTIRSINRNHYATFIEDDVQPEEVEKSELASKIKNGITGVATAMYQYAEKVANAKIMPSDTRTEDAQALWNQPNRPFGNEHKLPNEKKIFSKSELEIQISIFDEEDSLDKSEYYAPTKEGELHPTKPYVAKMHPDTGLSWHHTDDLAAKNDQIINDPQMRQKFLDRLPSHNHKAGMTAIMNMVAKDPNRHFIPSRDNGNEKMRARHIKALMLNPMSAKIDLSNENVLSVSMPRHGTHGGFTTWNYKLTPKKVVKNETDQIRKSEQGRAYSVISAVFIGRDSGRSGQSFGDSEAEGCDSTESNGGGNTGSLEDMESLNKSNIGNKIRTGLATVAIASAMSQQTDTPQSTDNPGEVAKQVQVQALKPKANPKKDRILSSIMDVESNNGQNTKHTTVTGGMNRGDRAYGVYGLMPITIRETVKNNPQMLEKHKNLPKLKGVDLENYMKAHPELEHDIASRHYDRLAKQFGDDPIKIARAWIGGITGTKQAIKNGEDLSQHWHVKKVKAVYDKRDK